MSDQVPCVACGSAEHFCCNQNGQPASHAASAECKKKQSADQQFSYAVDHRKRANQNGRVCW